MSTLFVVATPIGNLQDITLRALEVLKTVDVVACEDTRRTVQLLTHFGIKKPLVSCRAHNEALAAGKILRRLNAGETVAYASDAGTPGISDPGAVLVDTVRKAGHVVSPIPGASAIAALVSVAPPAGKTIVFEGFLSPRSGRRNARLRELAASGDAFVLYESPFRIVKLLDAFADIDSTRVMVVGRELTKVHEEILEGTASELRDVFGAREIRGEFTVFVSGVKNA
ncbi:MAG: 16S rRNA (cytidine(1402)-2'-O)-methyltransferase [Spirochaetaceae bacterium]|nr:16S rRNA (cytidine(1402)-2'-O)-methyltransferase [Spirochaetaceae bacterium]